MIQLIVGLGNPGAEYDRTRHNAGFWLLDAIASHQGVGFASESRHQALCARFRRPGGGVVHLLKPQTFMNRSGISVQSMLAYYRLDRHQMLVVHDELDLAPGIVRLKDGGGHAGHNGLRDIIARCGGSNFWRLRLGIGRPVAGREKVADYVLARPATSEQEALTQALDSAVSYLDRMLDGDMQSVMRSMHL